MKQIFLSYARNDRYRLNAIAFPEVNAILDLCKLVDYALLNQGAYAWYDQNIAPGTSWQHELRENILKSDGVVYLLSPASAASINCQDEIRIALSHRIPVLPVMLWKSQIPRVIGHIQVADKTANMQTIEGTCDSWHRWRVMLDHERDKSGLFSLMRPGRAKLVAEFDNLTFPMFHSQLVHTFEQVVNRLDLSSVGVRLQPIPNSEQQEREHQIAMRWQEVREKLHW